MASKFYAVKVGKTPGIYISWDDCKAQVEGVAGAVYKSFKTATEAAEFLGMGNAGGKDSTNNGTNQSQKQKQMELFREDEADLDSVSAEFEAVAYVDGSYNIATKEFSYGVVMFDNGEKICFNKSFNEESLAEMRNVAGEIKGSEAAMAYAKEHGIKTLAIYHDYEGIAKWPLRQWKANKEGTIAYRDFYDKMSADVQITFVKVKGHSGDKYNDEADKLAKDALGI